MTRSDRADFYMSKLSCAVLKRSCRKHIEKTVILIRDSFLILTSNF